MQQILAAFFPGQKAVNIEPLTSGLINATYRVDFPKRSYLLQKVNTRIFSEPNLIAENAEKAARHLRDGGYPKKILCFIPTAAGTYFYKDAAGNSWRISEFFSDTVTLSKPENAAQVYNAAAAYGEFLRYLSDFPPEKMHTIIPDFHNVEMRMRQFEGALKNAPEARKKTVTEEIGKVKAAFPFLQKINALQFPLRVTHNDTKISNLLFAADRLTPAAVIDWDTLMPGTVLSDFGDIVRTFCSTADENEQDLHKVLFREDYYTAAEKGFLAEIDCVLTKSERENLRSGAARVILVQAMRFLTDYLNENNYYATTYATQNADRTRNQLQLFEMLQAGS